MIDVAWERWSITQVPGIVMRNAGLDPDCRGCRTQHSTPMHVSRHTCRAGAGHLWVCPRATLCVLGDLYVGLPVGTVVQQRNGTYLRDQRPECYLVEAVEDGGRVYVLQRLRDDRRRNRKEPPKTETLPVAPWFVARVGPDAVERLGRRRTRR